MASSLYWSDLCTAAESRPLQSLQNDLYATSGVMIALFVICAFAHGLSLARWRKLAVEEKQREWSMHGWFTLLSCMGSAAGAIAFAARMVHLSQIYATRKMDLIVNQTNTEKQLMFEQRRDVFITAAALSVVTPLELILVVLAKLLVLHRLLQFSLTISHRRHEWDAAGRLFVAAIIVVTVIGYGGNVAASVHYIQAANYNGAAAIAWAANDKVEGANNEQLAWQSFETALANGSLQRFCEVSVLLLIIAVFFVVGLNSSRIISSALRALFSAQRKLRTVAVASPEVSSLQLSEAKSMVDEASERGKQLQRKVVCVVVFVFFTVLARSVFTIMYAFAQAFQNNADRCARSPCNPCKNVYSNIHFWILYSPVFQPVIMIIASPLALLVALWGMSDAHVLEQMASKATAKLLGKRRPFGGSTLA